VCGIAGIWERAGRPVDPTALERMGRCLRHRGPDGAGTYLEGEIGLAHRRLSILDLSDAAAQPMGTPDGDLWLNYNGEIHNYRELRAELEGLGAAFRSQGDTEVVLQAYRAWGPAAFERFNGMWALAVWEARARRLVLSRDRFGIKPLCYSVRGSRVAFASEPKAILTAFPEERDPDLPEVHAFLNGASPDVGPATFFANIRWLCAGTFAVFDPTSQRSHAYWSFVPGDESPKPDAEERFRHLLDDAVKIRLRSDVPVGACLSGGLDSSAIVRLAMRHLGAEPLHCFSLAYANDPASDESGYAALVADDPSRYRLHWVTPDADRMLETVARIVWHHDGPTLVRGRFAHWFLMREVSRHVKVVLEGHGGDELLGGYEHFILPYALDRIRLPRAPDHRFSPGLLAELVRLSEVGGNAGRKNLLRVLFDAVKRRVPFVGRPGTRLESRALAAACGDVSALRFRDAWMAREVPRPYRSRLNNALWLELRCAGLPEALHEDDALSMAFSIESRVPLLDHRVVEFCFSLPFQEKIRDGWTKSLLRRSLDGLLPDPVLKRRRKLGLPQPVARWLTEPANFEAVRALLLDPACAGRGLLEPGRLERKLGGPRPQAVRWARRYVSTLWRLVTLELWYRLMVDPARPQPPWPAAAPAMGTREARAEATPLPPGFIAG
jgi:asparagine synthase (glutamine-hydrolysing)